MQPINLGWLLAHAGAETWADLHAWSVRERTAFWAAAVERLNIQFIRPPERVLDLEDSPASPRWLPGAQMNIVESCFQAPANSVAVTYQREGGALEHTTVRELQAQVGLVAANLVRIGFQPGDTLAIFLPMTAEAVAIYLGIIQAGCVVVGLADSLPPREIAARLRIAQAKAVFTQDVLLRGGKEHPLFAPAAEAGAPQMFVLPAQETLRVALRPQDLAWQDFLRPDAPPAAVVARTPADLVNILFSSGTTGDPKAIPWTQTTPLKCGADAHFYHDLQPGDVVVWPTSLGWMMGPWLIFASLLNQTTIGLYGGTPTGPEFCHFVQEVRATVLGLVPSLVKAWRTNGALAGCDWSSLRAFSSTGECSSPADMRWLMEQAGGKPVIEYCGGTEIGGAYLTSSLLRPNVAGAFNAVALGLELVILSEEGQPAAVGEGYLVPPSMGLSTTLLNQDHYAIYHTGCPTGPNGELLRRHGDQLEALPDGYWRALGRADDTMNLAGIKISSAEIEQALQAVPGVMETAAIAVPPAEGGPDLLIIYAVSTRSAAELLGPMQAAMRRELSPLFRIHQVCCIPSLPRTASNKVMRRVLRARYLAAV